MKTVLNSNNYNLTQHRLCKGCIGEGLLQSEVERNGELDICHYCKGRGKTMSISAIADHIDRALEQHFQLTANEPNWFEEMMIKEGLGDWYREGDCVVDAISDAAEINAEPAEDIRKILEERYFDMELNKENPFDIGAYYSRREPDDIEYWENWRSFENSLKTEARYFSGIADATLENIFTELTTLHTPDGNPVIVEVGPETETDSLYRARMFETSTDLKKALKRPSIHIGPPPADFAKAGRMNAHGISVFYGATSSATAISEVRPLVGSLVMVGKFELLRKIQLLDVNALQSVYIGGSIFDPAYVGHLRRAKFLESLRQLISKPIMPSDEPLEHLVTQVIADYLANRSNPILDGIIYPSVQNGKNGTNVILFHKASRVAEIEIPKDFEIHATLGHWTDEGWETSYEIQEIPSQPRAGDNGDILSNRDTRDHMLRLDLESLEVHHINAASYDTKPHSVRCSRWSVQTAQEETPF